jgi:hypothetical protein
VRISIRRWNDERSIVIDNESTLYLPFVMPSGVPSRREACTSLRSRFSE